MNRFSITAAPCTIGFQHHARIDLINPIEPQLLRRRLFHRQCRLQGDAASLKKFIEYNASLRVQFSWTFYSMEQYQSVMDDCIRDVIPMFNQYAGLMTADSSCYWIGFVPHNFYDREVYKDMSLYSLILFNNDIIDFQIKVIEYISNHEISRQRAIINNDHYRFDYFKNIRKNRSALSEAYQYYINSINIVENINTIPRDLVEQDIGCHFLYQPDLFFELLEFSILKGEVHG